MHLKFLKHGTGSGRKAMRYLLSDVDHSGQTRACVKVLRGDPALQGQLIDSLRFKHRYSSGVIAWHIKDSPTDQQIEAVLAEFERTAWPGLRPDRYTWCAVLHVDEDGGKHVHVLSARVELATGKSLNIAPPGWQSTYDQLRDYLNFKYGWARPDDRARSRLVSPGRKVPVEKAPRQEITEWLSRRIDAGEIYDREDVINALSEIGQVTRKGKNYLILKPNGADREICLKGLIYEQKFESDFVAEASAENGISHGAGRAKDVERARVARRELERCIKARARWNRARFGASRSSDADQPDASSESLGLQHHVDRPDRAGDPQADRLMSEQTAQPDSGPSGYSNGNQRPARRDRSQAPEQYLPRRPAGGPGLSNPGLPIARHDQSEVTPDEASRGETDLGSWPTFG